MSNVFAAALVMGVGSIGTSFSIGMLVAKGLEAIGRNPEAASKVQTNMVLGLAFAEAIAIYTLVIALIILFV